VKGYRFRLEPVLRVRRLQEQVAANQLALATRDLHSARSGLMRSRRALESLPAPSGLVAVEAVQWTHAQADRLSNTARRRTEEVDAAVEAVHRAGKAWVGASQRTTVLERLDERRLEVWRSESDRSEAAELDDLATARTTGEGHRP
jgi:flagellar FliJ protein